MKLGISGRITRATITSPLTPLVLLAAILVGLIATITIPREEEPQISVPMVDIRVAAPGIAAADAVELVGKPLESIVHSTEGVEHVYTQAQDNGVLVTARFSSAPIPKSPRRALTRRSRPTPTGSQRAYPRRISPNGRHHRCADRRVDAHP